MRVGHILSSTRDALRLLELRIKLLWPQVRNRRCCSEKGNEIEMPEPRDNNYRQMRRQPDHAANRETL